ncbi:hypothetical protein [Phyllobacterium chamaecytisi]|uniref:hypothetical protein n=1 Tax=Phyllobacterium chamaecytisi TaxID=2876082 RepID=UPI001CCCC00D|nr:hypothetical protein [Phyllobacterium sp. KW56]MBZ9603057.1 hypothetical protein [Phyllobacterium sp. KW56]
MRNVSELVAAFSWRYESGGRAGREGEEFEEFVALTGFHRKHAMRLFRGDRETNFELI